MARRPESEPILSREDLAEFRMQLARLSPDGIEGVYKTVYEECRFDGKRVPAAAAIQQLVTVWKELRKFQKRK